VYEVLIERIAERDLKSLPTTLFDRMVPRIKALAEIQRPSGCHKLAGSRNDWRISDWGLSSPL
jgi:mRNA interferase RelE/StbE